MRHIEFIPLKTKETTLSFFSFWPELNFQNLWRYTFSYWFSVGNTDFAREIQNPFFYVLDLEASSSSRWLPGDSPLILRLVHNFFACVLRWKNASLFPVLSTREEIAISKLYHGKNQVAVNSSKWMEYPHNLLILLQHRPSDVQVWRTQKHFFIKIFLRISVLFLRTKFVNLVLRFSWRLF